MTGARSALAAAVLVLAVLAVPARAAAQDDPPASQVPTQDIVPEPNSGEEPSEAGDRGGALQLLVAVLIAGAIAGGVWHVSRQARRNATSVSEPGPRKPPGPA